MANAVATGWPSGSGNLGWGQEPTGMLMPGRVQGWPAGTQRAATPATQLLTQAVAYWDVANYRDGDRFLRNQGTGGELLDLRLGSSIVANSNDPKWLGPDPSGSGYVYVSDPAGNFLSVPHSAGTQVGDELDIRVDVTADNWDPGALQFMFGKVAGSGNANISYAMYVNTSSRLQAYVSDGTNLVTGSFTALNAAPFTTASRLRLRVTYSRNTGSGQYAFTLYYNDSDFTTSLDSLSSWTQIGVASTGTSIGATVDVSSDVRLGNSRASVNTSFPGRYFGGALLVAGSSVVVFNCDNVTSGSNTSWTDVYQTVTINRSTSGRKSVAVPSRFKGGSPVMLLGTDDYLEVPAENGWQHGLLNFDANDSFTVLAVTRRWSDTQNSGYGTILSKRTTFNATPGYEVAFDVTGVRGFNKDVVSGGTDFFLSTVTFTYGAVTVISMGVYKGNGRGTMTLSVNDISDAPRALTSSIGSMWTPGRFRIGGDGGTPNRPLSAEFYFAAVWRRVLTSNELKTLAAEATRRIA